VKEIIYRLPTGFLEKLKSIYPSSYPRICESFLNNKEQTFRINYLKTDLPHLRTALTEENIRFRELPWPRGSFILKSDPKKLQAGATYKDGLIYFQNISSMVPPVLLNPQAREKILDMCAAPGAKTSQIASLAPEDIELIALEKLQVRYEKLIATLKIQGADFVKAHLLDAIFAKRQFPEYFDKVLLDAPCSAEGRFYVPEPRTYKYWDDAKVKKSSRLQKNLLISAIGALKKSGELVYSTCTFSPEENEGVIDWALNKFKDMQVMPLDIQLTNKMQGLTFWKGKGFSVSLKSAVRIIPNEFMEGFFVVKLKKNP